jgi:hypothetical protein
MFQIKRSWEMGFKANDERRWPQRDAIKRMHKIKMAQWKGVKECYAFNCG